MILMPEHGLCMSQIVVEKSFMEQKPGQIKMCCIIDASATSPCSSFPASIAVCNSLIILASEFYILASAAAS